MIIALDIEWLWPRIVDKIQAIAEEYNEGWGAIDVYTALVRKEAFIYTHSGGDGFVVVCPEIDQWTKEPYMYIWLGWNSGGGADKGTYLYYLNELAAGMGAKKIVIESNRRGFERCGWKAQTVKYVREVVPL